MSKKQEIFEQLIEALYKSQPSMNYSSGRNGKSVYIDSKINSYVTILSDLLFNNLKDRILDKENYKQIVFRSIIDLFTEDKLKNDPSSIETNMQIFESELERKLQGYPKKITYHFPSLFKIDFLPINVGPVSIKNRKEWIETINVVDTDFLGHEESAEQWKKKLCESFESNSSSIEGIASLYYPFLKDCNSIVSVEANNEGSYISKNFANTLAKVSLDMFSLIFYKGEYFFQNVLINERLPPVFQSYFQSVDGYLSKPIYSLNKQAYGLLKTEDDFQKQINTYQPIFSHILYDFIKIKKRENYHPILAMQWVFALNWYAEGVREANDAIALVKLASCLDTLSSGGKASGIREVVYNILDKQDTDVFYTSSEGTKVTIHDFIKKVYDHGRSRIVHGTLGDIHKSFDDDREKLTYLAQQVLICSAFKLYNYEGDDNKTAFKIMK